MAMCRDWAHHGGVAYLRCAGAARFDATHVRPTRHRLTHTHHFYVPSLLSLIHMLYVKRVSGLSLWSGAVRVVLMSGVVWFIVAAGVMCLVVKQTRWLGQYSAVSTLALTLLLLMRKTSGSSLRDV